MLVCSSTRLAVARPDTIDVGERRFDAFLGRNFNSQQSWHNLFQLLSLIAFR